MAALYPIFLPLILLCGQDVVRSETTAGGKDTGWYANQYTNPAYDPGSTYGSNPIGRDSYVDAANDLSVGQAGQPLRYHYQMFPGDNAGNFYPSQEQRLGFNNFGTSGSMTNAWQDEEMGNNAGGSGLAGIVGLLGLKGLKGLKPLLLPIKLLLLLPLKLLLLSPLLIPLLALLLFIPVPVITVPQGRLSSTARELKDLAFSDDCLERVSCEATRFARYQGYNATWIQDILEKNLNPKAVWIQRVTKGMDEEGDCKNFTCNTSTFLRKIMKSSKQPESPSGTQ